MNDMSAVFQPRPSAEFDKAATTAEDFKDAMARLAVGVGVAACWGADGAPVGLLVSSIAAVSAEPPRILFCCCRKTVRSHNALFRARRISLNILSESDRAEAERFSSAERAIERFDPSVWSLQPDAPPRHRSALVGLTGTRRPPYGRRHPYRLHLGRERRQHPTRRPTGLFRPPLRQPTSPDRRLEVKHRGADKVGQPHDGRVRPGAIVAHIGDIG